MGFEHLQCKGFALNDLSLMSQTKNKTGGISIMYFYNYFYKMVTYCYCVSI